MARERESLEQLLAHEFLKPGELAWIFRVSPDTVTRWADEGRIRCIRTLGGHRRYRTEDVKKILETPGG